MPATARSIIVSAPLTNASLESPTCGSSNTHVPAYLYGAMMLIELLTASIYFATGRFGHDPRCEECKAPLSRSHARPGGRARPRARRACHSARGACRLSGSTHHHDRRL